MVELGIRLTVCALAAGGAWWLKWPSAPIIAQIAALCGAISGFVYLLEKRNLRSQNASTLVACLDAAAVASMLAAAGRLDTFGFLVLAPIAYAASVFRSQPTSTAPIAAGSLIAAHTAFSPNAAPSTMLMLQAAGVLAVGLLLNHRHVIIRVPQPVLPEPVPAIAETESLETLELRESYRRLKDVYRDLEQKSRRDRLALTVMEAKTITGERFFKALAMKLREMAGVESLALYTMAQFSDRMVVRGISGDYPSDIRDSAIEVDVRHAARQIAAQALSALQALSIGEPRRLANVLLKREGKVLGMVCVADEHPDRLAEAIELLEEVSELAAMLIEEEQRRLAREHRMAEAELLYEVAGTLTGARTPSALAARIARESWEALELDHLSIAFLDGDESLLAAQQGANLRFLDIMSFAAGAGLKGWLGIGAPEVVLHDVSDDHRLNPQEALKRRVGSCAILPIQFAEKPYGYVTLATHRVGGIDVDAMDLMRTLVAELAHAIAKLEGADVATSGLATPQELHEAMQSGLYRHMILLETVRKEQMAEQFGRPVFESAVRQFARRLRPKLPVNSLLCRKADGDFVVLLQGVSTDFATSWANEACAMASFVGLRLPGGEGRMPLALRAKVADLSQQNRQKTETEAVA